MNNPPYYSSDYSFDRSAEYHSYNPPFNPSNDYQSFNPSYDQPYNPSNDQNFNPPYNYQQFDDTQPSRSFNPPSEYPAYDPPEYAPIEPYGSGLIDSSQSVEGSRGMGMTGAYGNPQFSPQHNVPQFTPQSSIAQRPIVIPQISAQEFGAFARCYAPILDSYGIERDIFVGFIDELNAKLMPPLLLKGINAAGSVIGEIPIQNAQLVRALIQATSDSATPDAITSNVIAYMDNANRNLFGPKGLRATMVTTKDLRKKYGLKSALTPLEFSDMSLSVVERRIKGFDGYVADLTLHVPPSPNMLRKNVTALFNLEAGRQNSKLLESRLKLARKQLWYAPGMCNTVFEIWKKELPEKKANKLIEGEMKKERQFEKDYRKRASRPGVRDAEAARKMAEKDAKLAEKMQRKDKKLEEKLRRKAAKDQRKQYASRGIGDLDLNDEKALPNILSNRDFCGTGPSSYGYGYDSSSTFSSSSDSSNGSFSGDLSRGLGGKTSRPAKPGRRDKEEKAAKKVEWILIEPV